MVRHSVECSTERFEDRPFRTHLSSDHDRLYRFHRWQANLRILGVTEIKTVPMSHPFVERLIGTIRREFLDRTLSWTAIDLESKLSEFMDYYNRHRGHGGHVSLAGETPEQNSESERHASLVSYAWREHCRGLFHTPTAA